MVDGRGRVSINRVFRQCFERDDGSRDDFNFRVSIDQMLITMAQVRRVAMWVPTDIDDDDVRLEHASHISA